MKKQRYHFSQYAIKINMNVCFSSNLKSLYAFLLLIFCFLFNIGKYHFKIHSVKKFIFSIICIYIYFIWLFIILLSLSGDVEENPGPKFKSCLSFSICHWNLNSISARNFCKLSLVQAYDSIHKYDIIWLSETYLNSSILCDDDNLEIPGYNLIRADHPSDNKRGGVCIYYKNILPLRLLNINYLHECINFEIKIGNELCNFISFIAHQAKHKILLKNLLITLN